MDVPFVPLGAPVILLVILCYVVSERAEHATESDNKATGVWERDAGSNVWWIRYRADGVLRREKVGRKSDALALYQKRKSELRAGIKLPENMRHSSIRSRCCAMTS